MGEEGEEGDQAGALTVAGLLVALIRTVQEAVAALQGLQAGLAVRARELAARTGQGTACGCNTGAMLCERLSGVGTGFAL